MTHYTTKRTRTQGCSVSAPKQRGTKQCTYFYKSQVLDEPLNQQTLSGLFTATPCCKSLHLEITILPSQWNINVTGCQPLLDRHWSIWKRFCFLVVSAEHGKYRNVETYTSLSLNPTEVANTTQRRTRCGPRCARRKRGDQWATSEPG